MQNIISFLAFTGFVGFFSWYKLRKDNLNSREGYFLGGRSLSGIVIASSILLTNIKLQQYQHMTLMMKHLMVLILFLILSWKKSLMLMIYLIKKDCHYS